MDKMIKKLIDEAIKAREKAYAPYSKFKVGSALLGDNNKIYTGANVENASYGLSNCGERSAIFSAISDGVRKIKMIAIVADTTGPVSPCGACRQVIKEFATDNIVIAMANLKGEYKLVSMEELLPYGFVL